MCLWMSVLRVFACGLSGEKKEDVEPKNCHQYSKDLIIAGLVLQHNICWIIRLLHSLIISYLHIKNLGDCSRVCSSFLKELTYTQKYIFLDQCLLRMSLRNRRVGKDLLAVPWYPKPTAQFLDNLLFSPLTSDIFHVEIYFLWFLTWVMGKDRVHCNHWAISPVGAIWMQWFIYLFIFPSGETCFEWTGWLVESV